MLFRLTHIFSRVETTLEAILSDICVGEGEVDEIQRTDRWLPWVLLVNGQR